MKEILKSASKLVFLMTSCTICLLFSIQVILNRAEITEDTFKTLAGYAFIYYFTRDKGEKTTVFREVKNDKFPNPIE